MQQGQMIAEGLVVGVIFSVFVSPLGLLVYFVTRPSNAGLLAAIIVSALPLLYWEVLLWQSVVRSFWRTKFGRSVIVGRE
jgi:hypothetical protein